MHAAKIELVYLGVVGLLFLQSPILFSFGFDGLIMLDISRRIHVHSGLIRFHLSVFPERSQVALLISKPQKFTPFLYRYLSNIALIALICLACASSRSFLRTSSWA